MLGCVSMSEVTTTAAWLAGLALVALMATGWRKPARAAVVVARGNRQRRPVTLQQLHEQSTPMHHRTRWYRRVWALVWAGVLAVWVGAVAATLVGLGAAWLVIRLTELLRT
ncbi:MAG: hypothetical protein RLY45_1547 [Actinomycetota bacterium]